MQTMYFIIFLELFSPGRIVSLHPYYEDIPAVDSDFFLFVVHLFFEIKNHEISFIRILPGQVIRQLPDSPLMLFRSVPDFQFADELPVIKGNNDINPFFFGNLSFLKIEAMSVYNRFDESQEEEPPVSFHERALFLTVLLLHEGLKSKEDFFKVQGVIREKELIFIVLIFYIFIQEDFDF